MRSAYRVAEVRAAEAAAAAGTSEGALMRRAAAALARRAALMLGRVYGSRVLLLVGSGDNGGDALYAGAALAARGADVQALLAGSRAHPQGLAALRGSGGQAFEYSPAAPTVPSSPDLVIDGLLGIGGHGGLRQRAAELVERACRPPVRVLAVDIPSGVDADSGEVSGAAVRADVTVAMGALKPGLLVSPGSRYAGSVEVADIGLAAHLANPALRVAEASDVAALLPRLSAESDKYRRGVLGVVAGSATYPGAAVLAVGAALRAGAGLVRYVGVAQPTARVRAAWPEAVCTLVAEAEGAPADPEAVIAAGRVQAWLI
ncbi:MAG: NAD(P)H-hydrate epimerase, partial [Mycobacteriales bacterium]